MKNSVYVAVFWGCGVIAWEYCARRHFIIPSLWEISMAFVSLLKNPNTWKNIAYTTIHVYISLLFTIITGIIFGSLKFFHKGLSAVAESIIHPLQYVSAAVIAILATIVVGLSRVGPYLVIWIAVLPNIYIPVSLGLKEARKDFLELGFTYTKKKFPIFKHILFPQICPYLIVGSVRANAIAWKIAVTSELFMAAHGLGFMVNHYYRVLETANLFAAVIIIIIIGTFFDALIKYLKNYYFKNHETISLD